MNTSKMFDLVEASQWAEVAPATLRKWVERAEILVTKFGGRCFLTADEMSLMLWQKRPEKARQFDEAHGVLYED